MTETELLLVVQREALQNLRAALAEATATLETEKKAHRDSIRRQNARLEEAERTLYLKLNEVEEERDALAVRVAELEKAGK